MRTCQRWDERTTFNVALLSYVLDANKKLIQVKAGGRPVARVVIRLVPMTVNGKMVPTIVVERPTRLCGRTALPLVSST